MTALIYSEQQRKILVDLTFEWDRQDAIHPDGYSGKRDGIRLGIATAQDELDEAHQAWHAEKRNLPRTWEDTREELLQTAVVILRTIQGIDNARL